MPYRSIISQELEDARPITQDLEYHRAIKKIFGENLDDKRRGRRIVNGLPAKENQFPYQALLLITKQNKLYQCGGSFVHSNWVLKVS